MRISILSRRGARSGRRRRCAGRSTPGHPWRCRSTSAAEPRRCPSPTGRITGAPGCSAPGRSCRRDADGADPRAQDRPVACSAHRPPPLACRAPAHGSAEIASLAHYQRHLRSFRHNSLNILNPLQPVRRPGLIKRVRFGKMVPPPLVDIWTGLYACFTIAEAAQHRVPMCFLHGSFLQRNHYAIHCSRHGSNAP